MKKYLLMSSLLLLLVACAAEETDEVDATPTEQQTEAPEESPENSETETEGGEIDKEPDTANEDSLEGTIENYIDGLVNWKSFKMFSDATVTYGSPDATNEEYHQEVHYVTEPLQLYRSSQSILNSNMHFEQYVTEKEAFNNDAGEWIEVDVTEEDLINPIDKRIRLLNILISSKGNILANSFEYHHSVDKSHYVEVMNAVYDAMFGIPFDIDVELNSVNAVITVNQERIQKI
ncbi:MAG: hypothetical protein ABS882_11575, partial [Lysinibacillus sp.]